MSTTCRGVAQPGSAPALGAGGLEFKSPRPDHLQGFRQLVKSIRAATSDLDEQLPHELGDARMPMLYLAWDGHNLGASHR